MRRLLRAILRRSSETQRNNAIKKPRVLVENTRGSNHKKLREYITVSEYNGQVINGRVAELLARVRMAARIRRAQDAELDLWVADLNEIAAEIEDREPVSPEVEQALAELDAIPGNEISAKPADKFTQKSVRRKPKSQARDKRNIRKCKALNGNGAETPGRSHVSPLVDNTTHPLPSPSNPKSSYSQGHLKHLNADRNDKRKLAAWAKTGDLSKMFAVGEAVKEGGAMAFSLNLAGKVKADVDRKPASALKLMSDRLTKALKAEFGHRVEFAFVLEVSPAGNVHLHGILALDVAMRDRARVALEKAGGQWRGKGAVYQADARQLWNASGWTSYCTKTLERTKKALGVKNVLSVTQDLRRRAHEFWDHMRWLEANPA